MLTVVPAICGAIVLGLAWSPPAHPTPEARAVAFLCKEVPRWSRENRCFSCHHNGDAARALYHASRADIKLPEGILDETTRWLSRPAEWDHNGGDGPFSDKRLARIAFTTSLRTAVTTRWVEDRSPLIRAAERLTLDQGADGSWALEGEDGPGSPAAYGRPLATWLARDALHAADPVRFRDAIAQADRWLSRQEILTITGASVCLLAHGKAAPAADARYTLSVDLLRRGQSDDGGWGPRTSSPPESFDTALALLALANCEQSPAIRMMTTRGRAFLVAQQQADGSWIETTRPAGNISYAQRISTTGWATLALLATRELKH
jgi:hypothetical protein